jgi:hypothetical protein
MPKYGALSSDASAANQPACALYPGDSLTLFNAETPGAGVASIAFCRAEGASQNDAGTTFQIDAATVGVEIQGANQDLDAEYRTVFTSTIAKDNYTDTTRWAFYRAVSAGGVTTVIAQR